MENETGLPSDIDRQLQRKKSPGQEPPPRRLTEDLIEPPKEKVEAQEDETTDLEVCPATRCSAKLDKEWMFCARCGTDLIKKNFAKKLGIEFTEDDVQDYLFKGFVVKTVKVMGKNNVMLKTSQPKDLSQIDDFIMNGEWAKNAEGGDKGVSDFYFRQMNTLALAAVSILKVNGESIGNKMEDRVEWLQERGSVLVDKLTMKVQLFNQAMTEHLEKEDTLSGS